MKKFFKTFEEFIGDEAIVKDEFKKVCITREKELDDSFITGDEYHTPEYWHILIKDDDVPKGLPILNYDRKTLEQLLEKGEILPEQIYNKVKAKKNISSKSAFYKMHKDSNYIIPSVTDPSKIKNLKFPIVAKPDNKHSGLGITVFKNKEDFDSADLSKFTTFSEKINIAEEHRYWLWRGELIQWAQRVPMDNETANISKKDPEKETNFSYICKDIKNIKPEHLKVLGYFSNAHSDLDFYAIDLAETNDGSVYVFEMNSEPGALFGIMTILYQKIYEDYYKTELSQDTLDLLKKFKKEDAIQNTKQNSAWKVEKQ